VPEEVPDFVSGQRKFLFDLYRIAFNEGRGGEPEPLRGASGNGKSNYFPKYSPDARWIVFCQARSFMLLQPDSQLYILPAEGGEARRLECNTERMNSWHSWSPNGKWLVFSSKAYTLYTQLMLTHVDDRGHTTPPVVLAHFTAPNMAANIPEFVNTSADAIKRISYDAEFFADALHLNAGDKYAAKGDFSRAIEEFQKAVEANPDSVYGYRAWALVLSTQGKLNEAEKLLRRALEIAPQDRYVIWRLGEVLGSRGKPEEAERMYRDAIRIDSMFAPPYLDLARLLLDQGKTEQGRKVLEEVIRIKPDDPQPYCFLGDSLLSGGETSQAIAMYSKALEEDADCLPAMLRLAQVLSASPGGDPRVERQAIQFAARACELTNYRHFDALITLSDAHAAAGNFVDALSAANKALQIAAESGNTEQVEMAPFAIAAVRKTVGRGHE
jgi:tetratricopeptide (TPR) repeat protein